MREDRIDNQLVHLVDEGIDSGPIISNKLSLIPRECKIPIDFERNSLEKFRVFYKQFITDIYKGKKFKLKIQPDYIGRYNPRLNTEINGLIDWSLKPYDLLNFINSFDEPYKGASTYLNNGNFGKLFIKSVHLHGGDSSNHPYMSGIVNRHHGNWIVVSTTKKHMLLIEKILDKKGNNIISKIKRGDRFYTPIKELHKSNAKRIIYTTRGIKK